MKTPVRILAASLLLGTSTFAVETPFYKEAPLFSTAPSEKKSANTIARFGPVGMAIDLHQPAFVMHAGKIETGSPAATAGLKEGQIIESINGEKLQDIDPRIQLGLMIEKAEAADGVMKFLVREKKDAAATEVIVKIPALGAYSKTWPLNCRKSDQIVRNFAEHLKQPKSATAASRCANTICAPATRKCCLRFRPAPRMRFKWKPLAAGLAEARWQR
jgi:hypothetical protein